MKEYREYTELELGWIEAFRKLMAKAPDTLFLFVGSGITIFPLDKTGHRYMGDFGGVDGNANGEGIATKIDYDGGDY